MAFFGSKKKRGGLPDNFDLDMPPEPPKIGIEDDFSSTDSPDEELMPYLKSSKKQSMPELPELPDMDEHELPELPPLPDLEEYHGSPSIPSSRYDSLNSQELPPLPDMDEHQDFPKLDNFELPPLPSTQKKEKKGLFAFLKSKKAPKKMPESRLETLPPLPDMEEHELPELPPLPHEDEEIEPEHEFEEKPTPPIRVEPQPIRQIKPQKEKKVVEQPITRFININEFKKIQDGINSSKSSLKGIDAFFSELDSSKSHQDKKYEGIYNTFQDIHKKIQFIDKTLFKEV
ncbi:MAG: hypothetical protein KKC75_08310 [Nanoarchaeota archaeon]|nr:hypothetical protein [Nanoarchaeota archaeon]MBU1946516.1 hypothetical protein [Nanoarchaeota archaeon]